MLSRDALRAGFTGPIDPAPPSAVYRAGLVLVCVMMILLPLIYLAIIAGVGWAVAWHATNNTGIFSGARGRTGLGALLIYVTPILSGAVLIVFLVKPLFAPRARPPVPVSLDPKSEPLVFDLVRELCERISAPTPRLIAVDTQVNASASFRRGLRSFFGHDLQLTIGLPLVAGLTLRNLVGILAHEFGHFAQGSGMRATYVIRTVNAWFARVVYERDAWDATLAAWGRDTDFRIAIVIHVIRFCVWLTRRILWLLMLAGHAVSMFMLREMEYDADRYEVAIAGTESFVVSARAFPVLNLAHQGAIDTLSQSWTERRLGDDLPRLILAEHARIPDAARRELLDHHLKGKGSVFDTHPPDQRRIERAERTPSKGVFTIDLPAVELFRDFPGLSKRATTAFYREVLGKEFSEKNLVGAETMVAQESAARSDQDALARFFQDAVLPSAPLFVPDAAKSPAEDVEASARELRECADEVARRYPELKPALASLRQAEERLTVLDQLDRVARAGLRFKAADFDLKGAKAADIAAARKPVEASRESLVKHLAPLRELMVRRLTLGLRIARAQGRDDLAPLLKAQDALRDAFPDVLKVLDNFRSATLLLNSIQGNEQHEGLIGQLNAVKLQWQRSLRTIWPLFQAHPYPFDHASGKVTLAEMLIGRLPTGDELVATIEAVQGLGEKYYTLYIRLLGQLVTVAEKVEAAAPGSTPLPSTPASPPAAATG